MKFTAASFALFLALALPACAQQANPIHDIRWSAATGCTTASYPWVPADHQCEAPGGGDYTLPIATTSALGGVKPDGTSCSVNATTGVLSCSGSYTLPGTVVQTSQANTYSSGLQDFSSVTVKLPAGFMSGDCTMTATGAATCTKSSGTAFGTAAFQASSAFDTSGAAAAAQSAAEAASDPSGSAAARAAVGTCISGQFETGDTTSGPGCAATATATTAQASLASSNQTMTSTSTFYDGPTTGSLGAGTYFVTSTLTLGKASATTAATAVCKLWDGTSVFTSGEAEMGYVSSAAIVYTTMTLSAVVTESGSATIKMSCEPQTGSEVMYYQTATGSLANASSISAVRLK